MNANEELYWDGVGWTPYARPANRNPVPDVVPASGPGRRRRAIWIASAVVAFALVVAGSSTVAVATYSASGAGAHGHDVTGGVEIDVRTHCPTWTGDHQCWSWTLTPAVNCSRAVVTIGFSDQKNASGWSRTSSTGGITLRNGVSQVFAEPVAGNPESYAGIKRIVCLG
jgi:hypothetical protein